MTTGADSTGPVFVAGCGRSGTSYLRTLLDAHPTIWIPSETLCLTDYLRAWDDLPPRLGAWLFHHEPQVRCWYGGPQVVEDTAPATIARAHEYEAARAGATMWGQKTPRFVREIDLLRESYPTSRWILLYRDPRAVAASMLASGQHTHSIRAAAERWERDNRPLTRMLEGGVPEWAMVVSYEELVTNFAPTLERIWHFLRVEPISADQAVNDGEPVFFSRSRFPINTVRGGMKPRPELLDTWRDRLTSEDVAVVEAVCGQQMATFGYKPVTNSTPVTDNRRGVRERLSDARVVWRYLWYWPEYPLYVLLRLAIFGLLGARARLAPR